MKKMVAAACVVALMAGCMDDGATNNGEALWQSRWVLVEPALTSEKGPVWLEADKEKQQIYGFAGCNRFFAAFVPGDSLAVGPVGMTRMMCAQMATEDQVTALLTDAQGFAISGERLTVKNGKGQTSVWQAAPKGEAKP